MLRMNIPGIFVYGGTIKPGHYKGRDLTIVSPFEAVGEFAAGRMSKEDFDGIERCALPGTRRLRRHVHGEHDVLARSRRWA